MRDLVLCLSLNVKTFVILDLSFFTFVFSCITPVSKVWPS
jgi:hypothetical protein